MDSRFVEKFLTVFKPRDNDCEGWLYVYERDLDRKNVIEGKITDVILFKVGRTVKTPQSRVGQQEISNGESYHVVLSFKSKFHKFVEYAIHWMFAENRVVKTDSLDGRTEWFLIDKESLMQGIDKLRQAMKLIYKDI